MASLIEIQEAYIARVSNIRYRPLCNGSAGLRRSRSIRAAKRDAIKTLMRQGWTEADAAVVIKDAHDMYQLEALCD
jgi:hypothetical protein